MKINDNELGYKFTAWIKIVVERGKINYIRKKARYKKEVSVEDGLLTDKLIYNLNDEFINDYNQIDFDNESLVSAFKELTARQRQVLGLIYFNGLKPEEIAKKFGITVQSVYNVCSLAIKHLRRSVQK